MSLDDVAKHWIELGESDPLWAVLTDDDKKGNRWDPEEFLASGAAEIRELVALLERVGIEPTLGTALDFGCGAGRLTQGLVSAGFARAVGVDVSEPMITKARELNKHGEQCRFVVNTTADLAQFESSSADLVYTCRVLQHMPPTLAHGYIREFFRIAQPGAPVVFQIPNHPADSLVGRTMRFVPAPILNRIRKGMEMHGTPDEIVRELVAAAGGEIVKALPSAAAGHRWASHLYVCRKVAGA